MALLRHTLGELGTPAKLALGALVATVGGGGVYFLSTYEACEGCNRRREAMKAAFKNANLSAPPPQQQAVSQPQHPQAQH
jgi:hypothetical protein